jgi:nitrite reductase/ring-hydroxylating ferredoxin subunit
MSEFTVVVGEGELEAGTMHALDVDRIPVLVSRSDDGGVCAIAIACTHVGGPRDEGERDGNVVACPGTGPGSTCALGKCCGDRPESLSGASSLPFAEGG